MKGQPHKNEPIFNIPCKKMSKHNRIIDTDYLCSWGYNHLYSRGYYRQLERFNEMYDKVEDPSIFIEECRKYNLFPEVRENIKRHNKRQDEEQEQEQERNDKRIEQECLLGFPGIRA